jgi:hypothetical protein
MSHEKLLQCKVAGTEFRTVIALYYMVYIEHVGKRIAFMKVMFVQSLNT